MKIISKDSMLIHKREPIRHYSWNLSVATAAVGEAKEGREEGCLILIDPQHTMDQRQPIGHEFTGPRHEPHSFRFGWVIKQDYGWVNCTNSL